MFFKNDNDKTACNEPRTPALPLRDIIVFPHMVSPALRRSREEHRRPRRGDGARQGDPPRRAEEAPRPTIRRPRTSSSVGTIGTIMQLLRLPDGTVKVLVEGKPARARSRASSTSDAYFLVEVEELAEDVATGVEVEALMRSVQSTFEVYVKLNKKVPPEVLMSVQSIDDPAQLADTIVANLPTIKLADRQGLLETAGRQEAPRAPLRADAGRDRDPAGREEDPLPRQEADGEDAEGVLPQRADAGHPEGAGAASATSSRTRSRSSKRSSRPRR